MTFIADPPAWDEPPEMVTITDGSEEVAYYPLSDVLTAYRESAEAKTYVLCNRSDCFNHDGDGCSLEEVTIKASRCYDFEQVGSW